MTKTAIYIRVSTQRQEKEETEKTQLSKLKEYCKENDYQIVKEYSDVCSGAYLSRTALNQLREDAKKGIFDVICVYALDRLSRKLGHQIALLDEFEKEAKVKVESLEEKFEDTPEGMLNRNMRGAFAEYERYKIAKRLIDGKWRKVNEKKLIGCYPSFGYTNVKKTDEEPAHFEINPKEASMVKLIFKIYLETNSIYQTAIQLKEMGIKGRGRGKGKNGEDKPTFLHPKTIREILKNESYIGNWYYGKTYCCEAKYHIKEERKQKLTGRKIRPKSDWKLVKIPEIIDKEIFDRVQEKMNKKKSDYLKPSKKHFYLCQSLIKCIHCGRTYSGHKQTNRKRKKPFFTYYCGQKYPRRNKLDEVACPSRSMGRDRLDNAVWDYVKSLVSDENKVKAGIKKLAEKREKDRSFNQKVYNSLIAEKGKLEKKKQRFIDLYGDENFTQEEIDNKVSEVNNLQENLNSQIREVEKEFQKIENLKLIEKEIEKLCFRYKTKIKKNPSPELKKFIVRSWIKEINILDDGRVFIKAKLPELEEISREKLEFPSQKRIPAQTPQSL